MTPIGKNKKYDYRTVGLLKGHKDRSILENWTVSFTSSTDINDPRLQPMACSCFRFLKRAFYIVTTRSNHDRCSKTATTTIVGSRGLFDQFTWSRWLPLSTQSGPDLTWPVQLDWVGWDIATVIVWLKIDFSSASLVLVVTHTNILAQSKPVSRSTSDLTEFLLLYTVCNNTTTFM